MKDFVKFLVDNWQFISTAIITLLSVILLIVKKRPLTEILDNSAYKDLIILIKDAESRFGAKEGKKKLDYVLTAFCNIKGINKDSFTASSVKSLIENVLETPQKKGDK